MTLEEPIEFSFSEEEVIRVRNALIDTADGLKIPHAKMAVMAAYAARDMADQLGLDIKEILSGMVQ